MNPSASSNRRVLLASATASICRIRAQVLALTLVGVITAGAQDTPPPPNPESQAAEKKELTTLTPLVDELKWLKAEKVYVTSVSRRAEDPFDAAAAVSVITSEDIRRSGARTIPDALRMAPGLSVAQSQANKWAVASRGFAGSTGNLSDKLLVLVDGRTIYGNLISGVDWHFRDYPLEDIDRIEVIRGPGATLWGANAVNGIINIITKSAAETEGFHITSGVGIIERYFGSMRYGFKFGETGFFRLYGSYTDIADFPGGRDGSQHYQGGYRADWMVGELDLSLHGDYFQKNTRTIQAIPSPTTPANFFPLAPVDELAWGGNTVWQARREFSDESDLQLQSSFDWTRKKEQGGRTDEYVLDVDYQHRFPLPGRQNLMYGLGYRYYPDRSTDNAIITFDRPDRDFQLFSAFIQDEIELMPDRVWATIGSKFEHNDLTGFEVQPSGRLRWKPAENQTVWSSVSRAIQMPSASINNISVPILGVPPVGFVPVAFYPFVFGAPAPAGTPALVPLFLSGRPNPELEAQELIAYELGYRIRPNESLSLDWTGFFNVYDKLITGNVGPTVAVPAPPAATTHGAVTVSAANGGGGEVYGFELAADWRAREDISFRPAYSLVETHLSAFNRGGVQEPESQISLRTSIDLPHDVELDIWNRYVSPLHGFGIGAYFDTDIRIAWRPTPEVEVAIVGQNLISPRRNEFGDNVVVVSQPTSVPRSVYGQITLRF